jgi:hypothetical protein
MVRNQDNRAVLTRFHSLQIIMLPRAIDCPVWGSSPRCSGETAYYNMEDAVCSETCVPHMH